MGTEASAQYESANRDWQRAYDLALRWSRNNVRDFGGRRALVEGGGYQKLWLETQPMGGEMFAAWDMEAALFNQLLFIRHQRADGRLPGSIRLNGDGSVTPEYNKLQGFCFPRHALNMYWLGAGDEGYLRELRDCLEAWDGYLWRTRDTDGDGCLRSFCVYDTGEDNALRYGDAPNYWEDDAPPRGYASVPMASMDVTSWSYASRNTLRLISLALGDGRAAEWEDKARAVREAIRRRLWDEKRGACFDRGPDGSVKPELVHNTLRCMYFESLTQSMAQQFTEAHLKNPREFWTPFPLPSVSVSDPLFRSVPENNWSGQCEGLTWQRAVPALESYGMHKLVTRLGWIWLENLSRWGFRFVQQYDPFTGRPSLIRKDTHDSAPEGWQGPVEEGYGPSCLTTLTFLSRLQGVAVGRGRVWYSAVSGFAAKWERTLGGHSYLMESDGSRFTAWYDGTAIGTQDCGSRLVTDMNGKPLSSITIE